MATSEKILLPPLPAPATSGPEGPAADGPPHLSRIPRRVVLFVAVLGFLLAAFPARNADLWGHLASGRDLLAGVRPDGVSPTWLYDVVSYALFAGLGGAALVVAKALLVAGTAALLLRRCWARQGWGIPVFATVLALLAVSNRLALQPAVVSLFLFTLALWILALDDHPALLRLGALVLVFCLWANCDRWFVVGLAAVTLTWLGRTLDEGPRLAHLLRRGAMLIVLAGISALNPRGPGAILESSDLLLPWTSLFRPPYVAAIWGNPAALAYVVLLALSLLSFLLVLPQLSWERLLPWAALAVLSALQVRLIPFFALAAAPVLAANLQQLAAARAARRGDQRAQQQPGLLAALAGLLLLACAWPGWLQPPPFGPRSLAVEPSAAMVRGAETVHRWRQERRLDDAKVLHLSRESASAFAWFCPAGRGVYDDPLARAFRGDEGAPADWDSRLRAENISLVVLHDPDPGRLFAAGERLFADPRQWPLLHLEGNLAIFGWRDPKDPAAEVAFRGMELDLRRLAFRAEEVRRAPATATGGGHTRRWWEAFWRPAPAAPLDRGEATLHYLHADAVLRSYLPRRRAAWDVSQAVGLVGAAGGWGAPGGLPGVCGCFAADALDAHVRLMLLLAPLTREAGQEPPLERAALSLHGPFSQERDDVPPELLFLAVRSARRAVAEDPTDAHAYFVLGESYLRLLQGTRERAWAARFAELAQLRQAQASAALNQAVRLNPRFAQAHLSLGRLYQSMGYLDLALKHLRAFIEASPEGTPTPAGLSELARAVREQEEAYDSESGEVRSPQQRASLAMKKGLAGRARDMLEESNVAAFGVQGMALELELFVRTGRLREVREWTEPEQRASLGPNTYHMVRIQGHAAAGDYAAAQEECFELAKSLAVGGEEGDEPTPIRELMAMLVAQAVVDGKPAVGLLTGLYHHSTRRTDLRKRVAALGRTLRYETDVTVLRGLLALEEGDVAAARQALTAALAVWGGAEAAAAGSGMDFGSRPAAQAYLELLGNAG